MPDASSSDPEAEPQATSVASVSGDVNIDVQCDRNTGGRLRRRAGLHAPYIDRQHLPPDSSWTLPLSLGPDAFSPAEPLLDERLYQRFRSGD